MSEDPTRPVSVAELLARNGTIGSPPVGGHRRRKRPNAVSVAELTGEIPVIRTGEIPVVVDDESGDVDEPFDEAGVTSETVVVYASEETSHADVDDTPSDVVPDYPDYSDYQDYTPSYDEPLAYDVSDVSVEAHSYVEADGGVETTSVEAAGYIETDSGVETAGYVETDSGVETAGYVETTSSVEAPIVSESAAELAFPATEAETVSDVRPPLSSIPLPRRRRGPERSHDPRPRRRSTAPEPAQPSPSGAEQMSPDPVDEEVDLAELVAEQAPDPAELRSYLKSSSGTLFFGETVADDLARRGELADSDGAYNDGAYNDGAYNDGAYNDGAYNDDDHYGFYGDDKHGDDESDGGDGTDRDYPRDDVVDDGADTAQRGPLKVLGTSLVAVAQSLLAVVFGAALFIGFDQLWRWNNIVALALSALVIAALMIGVHVVRKTEDFVSTLIAVLVGILVTFGPLALQST